MKPSWGISVMGNGCSGYSVMLALFSHLEASWGRPGVSLASWGILGLPWEPKVGRGCVLCSGWEGGTLLPLVKPRAADDDDHHYNIINIIINIVINIINIKIIIMNIVINIIINMKQEQQNTKTKSNAKPKRGGLRRRGRESAGRRKAPMWPFGGPRAAFRGPFWHPSWSHFGTIFEHLFGALK